VPEDRVGTYTCVIKYGQGVKRVYWNPTKRVKVTTAKSATFMVGVYGKRTAVKGGTNEVRRLPAHHGALEILITRVLIAPCPRPAHHTNTHGGTFTS
jgi:hypothetical protein